MQATATTIRGKTNPKIALTDYYKLLSLDKSIIFKTNITETRVVPNITDRLTAVLTYKPSARLQTKLKLRF